MSKTKQALWTKFGGKEFFARMAENATNDGEGNEISQTYATKDVATTTADGLLSKDDKSKLNNIAAGAQVNTIESISANGTALSPDGHKNVDIPLATSEVDGLLPHEKFPLIPVAPVAGADRIYSFDDDTGTSWQTIVKEYVGNMILDQLGNPVTDEEDNIMYEEEAVPLWLSYKGVEFGARRAYDDHTGANIHDSIASRTTMAQVTTAIETALANYGGFVVVNSLVDGHPDVADPSERFIYLYKDPNSTETDPYTEWIYTVDNEWDVIGTTSVDLTPYYTRDEVESRLDTKVDKVTGKGLSTNDYTTDDKNKLTGIESGAEINLIESVSVAGTVLDIENKAVNVPEAGGSTGAWVKGVVSGEDTTRWDNWKHDANITIPLPKDTIEVKGHLFKYVQIGNLLVTTENLDIPLGTVGTNCFWFKDDPDTYGDYGMYYKFSALGTFEYKDYYHPNEFVPTQEVYDCIYSQGWRIWTETDFYNLAQAHGHQLSQDNYKAMCSTTGWKTNPQGTNELGFNAMPTGERIWNARDSSGYGEDGYYFCMRVIRTDKEIIRISPSYWHTGVGDLNTGASIRLVKDVNA